MKTSVGFFYLSNYEHFYRSQAYAVSAALCFFFQPFVGLGFLIIKASGMSAFSHVLGFYLYILLLI